jgi:3-isopropylmalate dehydratase small subunit
LTLRRRGPARLVPGTWTERDFLAGSAPLCQRLRPEGTHPVERGDILVCGPGLGAGTSTDTAALALAQAGVGGVVAPTMDRAFRDACLHAGVPVLVLEGLPGIGDGDDLTVDFEAGTVEDVTRRRMLVATPLTSTEIRLIRVAPSLAWYGITPGPPDPDVVETVTVPPNDY